MNNNKRKLTFERCHICDYQSDIPSIYSDGLADPTHGDERYVFIDRDSKPICTVCYGIAMDSLSEFDPPEHTTISWLYEKEDHGKATPSWNIDWKNLEYTNSGGYKFPLTLKDTPRPLGWRLHTRASRWPVK